MAIPKNPCYQCERRCVACHSSCVEYAIYKTDMAEYNAVINKAKDEERIRRDYEIRQVLRRRH